MKGILRRLLIGKTLTTKSAVASAAFTGFIITVKADAQKEEGSSYIAGGYKQAQNILSYISCSKAEC